MKHYLPLFFWVVTSCIAFDSFAQISIDYPSDRAVFQRDKNNSASVFISGSYIKVADKIEAKLTPLQGGEPIDWTSIQNNPQGGFFTGNLNARGGWYRLEVRALKNNQVIGSHQIDHVGVGEVFLVAGQSNGQGYNDPKFGVQGSRDDRVSSVSHSNVAAPNLPPLGSDYPYPQFRHLDADADISPRGKSAWCWGRLGDRLAEKLQVPILFYNAAWYGTAVRAWRESINGTAYSVYNGVPIEPFGMPYDNLRAIIQRYTPITGLRGILWLQGEADNFTNTHPDSYANDLRTVIEATRNESGKNISWMISLTSYDNARGSDSWVTEGQQRVVNNVPNVFQGPLTDLIQIPRVDDEGVHFTNDGLTQLGDAWFNTLNDNFFSNSDPYTGIGPLKITAACADNINVRLSVENVGVSQFSWSNGQNSSSIQVGNGSYRVYARDERGNYLYSPEIRIFETIQPIKPTISLEGSNPVCLGNTATLIASTTENTAWNTGATGDRLPVTVGGDYFVTTKNIYGCQSTSDKITMRVVDSPLPATPKITASGGLVFCDGGEVNLTSDSKETNVWSNGANTALITVKTSGEFKVRALDNVGCYSPESEPVSVKVNPLPLKPVIALSGSTTFCDGENVTLTSNYDTGNIWNTNATTKDISVNVTGEFTLTQRDGNGCTSVSDPVSVKVNPLPATPQISALRPTTFCTRDYTTLRSSEAFSYLWNNGSTDREIEIRQSGDFTISSKDENGCVSKPSAVVKIVSNPLPATPTITADGPTTFCADLSVNLQSTAAAGFLWSNGEATQTLKVTRGGTYSVQTINEFQCYSDPSNEISTQTLTLPPSPIVQALGATMICDGDSVVIRATKGSIFFWSNGEEGDMIKAFESGSYSARVRDEQGCYSPYSAATTVDVKPAPSVPEIRQTGVYTLRSVNNLEAGIHVWKFNDNLLTDTSSTLKAIRSGTYKVNNSIVYSPTLTCASEFSEPFSFYADSNNPGFVAYPSPNSTGRLAMETLVNLINAEVQIIDSRGIVYKTFKVNRFDSQKYFNIAGLPSGIYIIRLVSPALTATQKLIVVQ